MTARSSATRQAPPNNRAAQRERAKAAAPEPQQGASQRAANAGAYLRRAPLRRAWPDSGPRSPPPAWDHSCGGPRASPTGARRRTPAAGAAQATRPPARCRPPPRQRRLRRPRRPPPRQRRCGAGRGQGAAEAAPPREDPPPWHASPPPARVHLRRACRVARATTSRPPDRHRRHVWRAPLAARRAPQGSRLVAMMNSQAVSTCQGAIRPAGLRERGAARTPGHFCRRASSLVRPPRAAAAAARAARWRLKQSRRLAPHPACASRGWRRQRRGGKGQEAARVCARARAWWRLRMPLPCRRGRPSSPYPRPRAAQRVRQRSQRRRWRLRCVLRRRGGSRRRRASSTSAARRQTRSSCAAR